MADMMRMTEADHARVTAAVREAEAGTAGEIVTIVADRSDVYRDTPLWWGIAAAMLNLAALAAFPLWSERLMAFIVGGWISETSPHDWLTFAAIFALAMFVLVWLIVSHSRMRVLLTLPSIRHARVRDRAVRLFKVGAQGRTIGRTGILLYLSLAEHRAEIVADEAIHQKIAPEAWGQAMADLVGHVREGRVADGMIAAIGAVGALLAQHLPRAADDSNELPDRLIEL